MALEREALSHKIEDDLALRNRNWSKLDSHFAESASNNVHGATSAATANTIVARDSKGRIFVGDANLASKGQVLSLADRFQGSFAVGSTATSNISLTGNALYMLIIKSLWGANGSTQSLFLIAKNGNTTQITPVVSTDIEVSVANNKIIAKSTNSQARHVICSLISVGD